MSFSDRHVPPSANGWIHVQEEKTRSSHSHQGLIHPRKRWISKLLRIGWSPPPHMAATTQQHHQGGSSCTRHTPIRGDMWRAGMWITSEPWHVRNTWCSVVHLTYHMALFLISCRSSPCVTFAAFPTHSGSPKAHLHRPWTGRWKVGAHPALLESRPALSSDERQTDEQSPSEIGGSQIITLLSD